MKLSKVGVIALVTLGIGYFAVDNFNKSIAGGNSLKELLNSTTLNTTTYPQNYFRLPMDIPVAVAGTFGELRPNHFHTGIDFKTQQKEGIPVYAVADGYVSRLKVQIWGYGNSIYISHPNGYSSVYAHLQRYTPEIEGLVTKRQYTNQSFEVDFFPDASQVPVKKGQLIGYSGNTGSSQGPHLHFEIRETKTENPVNPLLFGLNVPDTQRPTIKGFYVYPMSNNSNVNGKNSRANIPIIAGADGKYTVAEPIKVNGNIGFGIISNDTQDGSLNVNGVYSITLNKNNQEVFNTTFDYLKFSQQRMINSYFDYAFYKQNSKYIQKSFIDQGNKLPVYKFSPNAGVLTFNNDELYDLEYIVKDAAGNTTTLKFKVKSESSQKLFPADTVANSIPFAWNKENKFSNDNVSLVLPVGSLFTDMNFVYKVGTRIPDTYSDLHQIGDTLVPIGTPFILKIKSDTSLLKPDKAVIVNSSKAYQGGTLTDGYISASIKAFGSYCIMIDTIAPTIVPLNQFKSGADLKATSTISFKISDNLSGIKSWNGYIDGKWVLFSFDGKSGVLKHKFDKSLSNGNKHYLQLAVTDNKDNIALYEATFIK